ncbi:glucose-6-phosphate isomerase [Synoicihabitans lomoniglobus]|uniref:Glucose-6-phosphate isomerase n=1 Tax=Synoicihabitans lomoniglobus TaxID=2909285 RepID=A0AAF0I4V9_9BACT|nr:glucose-6-phosphate isomerase [Opitutaceae bacterium LMO-M01]WED67034.1 glucose-6-phosphate isomerase [Opitutaceae bacterium LMO-M01]
MSWDSFKQHYHPYPELGLALDLSRLALPEDFLTAHEEAMQAAFKAMNELEAGAIANPDEGRMVGHYWLRDAALAPDAETRAAITDTLAQIKSFTADVHAGTIAGPHGAFTQLLVIGIGGSALGPQFVHHALGQPAADKMTVHFFDNTDPDGMDYTIAQIGDKLAETLAVVISKSGGTAETRNGMLEASVAFRAAGLDPARHLVAVTGTDSKLDKVAVAENWLARFPMWDWVGGRTSELCVVGLLPAALQGIDIDGMLAGAAAMDAQTRIGVTAENPAALLALAWHHATAGRGAKDMVVLPYKDRLLLFSRYLQQLIMESLGKELDLAGNVVNQGIAVYGNKGSTDQHAYVQQLREGVNNFFVTFIEVLKDRSGDSIEVNKGVTSGDYLQGFLLGTRDALSEKDRTSVTLTVNDVSPRTIGMLIALYERVVGFYASLIGINAYHQPGVEAGKKAAGGVIALKNDIQTVLADAPGKGYTAEDLAAEVDGDAELTFKILEHLAANGSLRKEAKEPWFESLYGA